MRVQNFRGRACSIQGNTGPGKCARVAGTCDGAVGLGGRGWARYQCQAREVLSRERLLNTKRKVML